MIRRRIITDLSGNNAYLVRWSLWLPFGMSLKIHQILRADDDRCSHDHPWWMLRLILKGGYTEIHGDNQTAVLKPWRPWAPWRIYWCPTTFKHRITSLTNGPSWTLALVGGKSRPWGFFTKNGWMPWEKFVNETRQTRVMWCDDADHPQELK